MIFFERCNIINFQFRRCHDRITVILETLLLVGIRVEAFFLLQTSQTSLTSQMSLTSLTSLTSQMSQTVKTFLVRMTEAIPMSLCQGGIRQRKRNRLDVVLTLNLHWSLIVTYLSITAYFSFDFLWRSKTKKTFEKQSLFSFPTMFQLSKTVIYNFEENSGY